MENGSTGPLADVQVSEHTKNGVVAPIMAKLPEGNISINQQDKSNSSEIAKVNGDNIADIINNDEHSFSSESDALIIDESINKKEKVVISDKLSEDDIDNTVTHSNPYFNESLFELSQLHQNNQEVDATKEILDKNLKKLKKKGKAKPKIREYAQYLGLQPSVQFKCPKCNRAGFESLSSLQEHVVLCTEESVQEISQDNSYSGFKLTRKVFLCSACGTYYENWNLYIHMLEFHKRFICLYCLGMFSILEDLCQHIQSRHNLEPGYRNTPDEFFNVYNEPCYIACCECNKLFSEQDNFFYHNCVTKNKCKKPTKKQITPDNHVTGESEPFVDTNLNMEDTTITDNLENVETTNQKQNSDVMEQNVTETSTTQLNCQSNSPAECNNIENVNLIEDSSNHAESVTESPEEHDTSGNKSDNENVVQTEIENNEIETTDSQEFQDTRKVPKLSLKLPKIDSYKPDADADDSDDSEKLTMEIDQVESECENVETEQNIIHTNQEEEEEEEDELAIEDNLEKEPVKKEAQLQVAGPDISVIELQLEQPLDKFEPKVLLQKCLKMTIPTCIYCNHARKIAVNGKQLALHCIAEHRFSAVVNSITAEELIPQNFVNRIKESLDELSTMFFNLDSSFSDEAVTFSHLFECFQCHFSTTVHKELYLHNRKYHSKNLLLCIMCKSNFYSYSELVCHLCPGVYILDYELKFRCCMCVHEDLPSSFRMMVHLRKKHNVCDVCLETCHTQHRLSNHVWKHKLHHFCYRCGIAYRNKPDITRHLFWKHGTESVLCKKCLQKKWSHVYHFCVPPTSFVCEECSLIFTRAVSLKVHKRLHTNEKKHSCSFEGCEEKFISKKLQEKHYQRHLEPPEESKVEESEMRIEVKEDLQEKQEPEPVKEEEKSEEKPKPKIDVLEDLPALNLSESDSSSESESEDNPVNKIDPEKPQDNCMNAETELEPPGDLPPLDILQEDKLMVEQLPEESNNAVMQNIWDNFKTYQEQQQKLDSMFTDTDKTEDTSIPDFHEEPSVDIVLQDHDYCANPEKKAIDTTLVEVKPALQESVDHDYCFSKPKDSGEETAVTEPAVNEVQKAKTEEKKTGSSSSSSSDSDSSSCSCGSNCSCSSSSGSSSSSSGSSNSDSSLEAGKQRQLARKQKRKERAKKLKDEQEDANKVEVKAVTPIVVETPIRESDLETTESETDEEFYDEAPQKLAKKILEEKRQQLLELMGPNSIPNGSFIESTSRPPTPPAEAIEHEERKKKKSKSKKKKRKKSERKPLESQELEINNIIPPDIPIPPYYQQFHQQQQSQPSTKSVAPITLTISRNSPISSPSASISMTPTPAPYKVQIEPAFSRRDSMDSSLRASKRRRVPNKFYGYSSDEEQDKPATKWKKSEGSHPPRSPQVVPPITIKTQPPPPLQPPIEPISIRTGTHLSDFRVARPRPKPSIPPIRLLSRGLGERDSGSDSNDSSSEEPSLTPKPAQPQLYCYCQCPYDEVSEMIGCDATDCAIEWFHFECVGIMVPPKGQWYCPDCRKKKARREIMQSMKSQSLNN